MSLLPIKGIPRNRASRWRKRPTVDMTGMDTCEKPEPKPSTGPYFNRALFTEKTCQLSDWSRDIITIYFLRIQVSKCFVCCKESLYVLPQPQLIWIVISLICAFFFL